MSKGTVYRRKDGRWECRISMGKDDNGKRVFRSFYGKTREEAEYKAMIAQEQAEEDYAVTEMTVKELVTEWLYVMTSRIKESTAANYAMKAEKHLMSNVRSFYQGGGVKAVVTNDGSLYIWGSNENGLFGTGYKSDDFDCSNYDLYYHPDNYAAPYNVMKNVESVSIGNDHMGAVTKDGTLYMWGSNGFSSPFCDSHKSKPDECFRYNKVN